MMFRPLGLCIASRYIRARHCRYVVSFIAFVSVLGIALGVAILITVLSVMNGFDHAIKHHIFRLTRQVVVSRPRGIEKWTDCAEKIAKHPHVVAWAPFVEGQVLLKKGDAVVPALIEGILPQQHSRVMALKDYIVAGHLSHLRAGSSHMVLGRALAAALGVHRGDMLTVVTPQIKRTLMGVMPRLKSFRVSAIFQVGDASHLDRHFAFIHLKDAQDLLGLGHRVSSLQLKLDDVYQALSVRDDLYRWLPDEYTVWDWTTQYGSYFDAIAMEKNMMFLILMLIVAVASFNLVASLVMVVRDKRADIAILRTLGATPGFVMRLFLLQGGLLGGLGTLLGVGLGLLLSHHATAVVAVLQRWLHTKLIPASIYFIDYLPSRVDGHEVIKIALFAFGMSLLATLYPARWASKVQPVEALRDAQT